MRWQRIEGASEEVIPNIHPLARDGAYPASAVGQAGYHMADTACPISAETFDSALLERLERRSKRLKPCSPASPPPMRCAARPATTPSPTSPAASASSTIRRSPRKRLRKSAARVAILDVDLHHGNGTQGIFYARPDVLTVSLHADPVRFYPFFWGHADERGEGPGLGYNLNLPLPRKSGDDVFLDDADNASFRRIRAFAPDALVVALGLDAFEGDPFGGLSVIDAGLCAHRRGDRRARPAHGRSCRRAAISATRSATI